jgi:hypothetical protein
VFGWISLGRSLFSRREHSEEIGCLVVAEVIHLILVVGHRVFAFIRLMAVASALALASILRHLIPIRQDWFASAADATPP